MKKYNDLKDQMGQCASKDEIAKRLDEDFSDKELQIIASIVAIKKIKQFGDPQ